MLLVAPHFLGFVALVAIPIITVFVYSVQNRNLLSGEISFAGFENYRTMAEDPFFSKVAINSLIFSGSLVPLNVVLAFVLAYLLTRGRRGEVLFRTVFFAPVITSAVAWALVWRFLLQDAQGINGMLSGFGIDGPNWLREPGWAMTAVVFTRVVKNVGLNMLIFIAAMKSIPPPLIEAASVDGATTRQQIRHIIIPQMTPIILLATMITVVGSMQVLDHITLMTGGGPENATNVLVFYIVFQAFKAFQIGYASSLAVVLFGLTMVFTLGQWMIRRRISYQEEGR